MIGADCCNCAKVFFYQPSKSSGIFCSVSCYHEWRKLNMPKTQEEKRAKWREVWHRMKQRRPEHGTKAGMTPAQWKRRNDRHVVMQRRRRERLKYREFPSWMRSVPVGVVKQPAA